MLVQKLARQGDLLFIKRSQASLKQAGKVVPLNILAFGEVTGHKHVASSCDEGGLAVLEREVGSPHRLVDAEKSWKTDHDEHATITCVKGIWEIRRQREYEPEEIRLVVD